MEFAYYPGCSLTGTAAEYDESVRTVFRLLNIGLTDIPDWNCCGASSGHVTDEGLAIELAARNLRIADQGGLDIVVPCAACYQRLKFAEKAVKQDAKKWIGTDYSGKIKILHVNDALIEQGVLQRIKVTMKKKLSDLEAVPYYGCLTVRPPKVTDMPDFEDPKGLDTILSVLGVTVKKWSFKTDCCGGSLSITRPDIVRRLTGRLFDAAGEAGAKAIVTDCPLCQANLDTRQNEVNQATGAGYDLPIFYITELIALACMAGDTASYWRRHFVDPKPLLSSIGL